MNQRASVADNHQRFSRRHGIPIRIGNYLRLDELWTIKDPALLGDFVEDRSRCIAPLIEVRLRGNQDIRRHIQRLQT